MKLNFYFTNMVFTKQYNYYSKISTLKYKCVFDTPAAGKSLCLLELW